MPKDKFLFEKRSTAYVVELDPFCIGYSFSQPCNSCNSALSSLNIDEVLFTTGESNAFESLKYKKKPKKNHLSIDFHPRLIEAIDHMKLIPDSYNLLK